MKMQKTFPCSVALVVFLAGALSCSVALVFVILRVPLGARRWAQRGRQKRYKTNAFSSIFKMMSVLKAAATMIPKNKIGKKCREK